MPFSGVCGIWATKSGDFTAHPFPGDAAGLAAAITYCGSSGTISIYPGGEALTIPTIPTGVQVRRVGVGLETVYSRGGARRTGVNVRDFPTFQAAHDALPAAGGTIFVPAGTYTSTTPTAFTGLVCTKRVSIIGEGGGPANANTVIVHNMAGAENINAIELNVAFGCAIRDIFLQGNGIASGGAGGCGIKWYKAGAAMAGLQLENVTLFETSNWAISAVCDPGFYVSKLECLGVSCYGALAGGSLLLGATGANSNNNWFDRCEFNGPGFGTFSADVLPRGCVHIVRNGNVRFSTCSFQGPRDSPAISVDEISTDIMLRDCYREYATGAGASVHTFMLYGPVVYFFVDGLFHQASANDTRLLKTGTAGPVTTSVNLRRIHCQANQNPLAGTEVVSLGSTGDRLNVEHCFEESSSTGTKRDLVVAGAGAVLSTIASAATITIPDGTEDAYFVSGNTTITSIAAARPKRRITLIFTSTAQVTDGSNLILETNFTGGANRVLELLSDGTNWRETGRRSP